MPWYKAGTVSVTQNSNAVIGTSTAFIANSRVGDAFRGPDGGWYEVTNIASDTAMSISPNYQGTSSAAGAYALAPMQGYVRDSADALRALVNQFGGVLAVLGTNPTTVGVRTALNLSNTDGLSEGTANKYLTNARVIASTLSGLDLSSATAVVAVDSILVALGKLQAQATGLASSKAAKGANSDITSIAGLTTALAVNQGGTGGNTQALARTGLGLGSAAVAPILGIVSQAAGVPNGAIFEYNSNANGDYTKYADGRMICTRKMNFALTPNTAWGASFITALQAAQSFAATFITPPTIDMLLTLSNGYSGTGWLVGVGEPTTTTWPAFYIADIASRGITSFNIHYTANGRWF